jgi:LAO/AO transport system kinase
MATNLTNRILKGDIRAAARLMSDIEDGIPEAIKELGSLYFHTGKAYVVGLTGAPGVGKSTLADSLIGGFRRRNMTVGVVAVDPSSPFTGGALLGDRIRMQRHSADKGVFIRSLATKSWGGGLSKATTSTIHILDAMGKDIILVETVGSGQIEIEIVKVADTTILVLAPGSGDAVQMLKAGILEAADIFVINKADWDGADSLKLQLDDMLSMKPESPDDWKPGIVLAEALRDKGTEELITQILRHREFLVSSGQLVKRRRERAKRELVEIIEHSMKDYVNSLLDENYLEKVIDHLLQRKTNPYSAALRVVNQFINKVKEGK